MTSEIQDLIETVTKIGDKKYRELSIDLVIEILTIESNFSEDRAEAIKRIDKLVDDLVAIEMGEE